MARTDETKAFVERWKKIIAAVPEGKSNEQQDTQKFWIDLLESVLGIPSGEIAGFVDFERKVSQTITTMPYVDLPDGTYSLSATVCWDGDFDRLVMYAESGGEREARNLTRAKRGRWERLSIKELKVSGGRAVVGFRAKGKAGAYCRIDDVELVRVR